MLKVLSALPWPVTRASQAALYKLDVKAEGTTLRAKAFVQARNTSWKPFASRLQKAFRHGHSHGFTTPRGTLSAAYHDRAQQENADIPLEPGLYLVGTPIGNLEDISLRALRILRTATIVLAEDTRHSKKLLNHFNIKAQLYSFHQHNENSKEQVVCC